MADATLAFDRGDKRALYARFSVPEYWVLDLPDRTLEVYRSPSEGDYGDRRTFGEGESIAPLARPGASVAVGDLLP